MARIANSDIQNATKMFIAPKSVVREGLASFLSKCAEICVPVLEFISNRGLSQDCPSALLK
jgi:hypothetical protein